MFAKPLVPWRSNKYHVCVFVCVCVTTCVGVCGCMGTGMCLCMCNLTYTACSVHATCCLRPLWLYHVFRHYFIKERLSEEKLLNVKCVFWFSLRLLFDTFLILRRIQRDTVINVKMSSWKVPVIPAGFLWNMNFLDWFLEKACISNLMEICPVGARLFHANVQMYMMKVIVTFLNFANVPEN